MERLKVEGTQVCPTSIYVCLRWLGSIEEAVEVPLQDEADIANVDFTHLVRLWIPQRMAISLLQQ